MKTKKEITVIVAGKTITGKSRLLYLLKNFLKQNGFEVEFDGGTDYDSEENFDKCMLFRPEVVDNLYEQVKIIFKEERIND